MSEFDHLFPSIVGYLSTKRTVHDTIIFPLQNPSLIAHFGLATTSPSQFLGCLFYGPHGCGKSLFARSLSTALKCSMMVVRSSSLQRQYFGGTEEAISNVFREARGKGRCVLIFEDFDLIGGRRGEDEESGGLNSRTVGQLLSEMDGVGKMRDEGDGAQNSELIVVGCVSSPKMVDSALLRPGRFEHHVEVGLPTLLDRQALISHSIRASIAQTSESAVQTGVVEAAKISVGQSCSTIIADVRNAILESTDFSQPNPSLALNEETLLKIFRKRAK